MNIKPKLMWRRKAKPGVADGVARRADEAAQLAKIPGQHRLTDPRTNPAVRPHADRLRDDQHRKALDAENGRLLRRLRVADRRADAAEKSLQALQEARETLSPAKAVLALHSSRNRYLRISLGASIGLAFGSALGLEHLAETHDVPTGSGYISEVGLTGLATAVILARSELTRNGGELKRWQDGVLWALMVAPLSVSMAGNIYGQNLIGAVCAAMAAAFSLFSYVVADAFASSAGKQAKRVSGSEEKTLHEIAAGDDLFSQPMPQPSTPTFFEAQGMPFIPVSFRPRETVVSATVVDASTVEVSDLDPGQAAPKPLTQGTAPEVTRPPTQVTSQVTSDDGAQVTTTRPVQVTCEAPSGSPDPAASQVTSTPPAKPRSRSGPKARRTDEELKADLQVIVAEHYRNNPGVEIKVQPVAAQLSIGRDRARRLLDEMSVRPMRKAANQ